MEFSFGLSTDKKLKSGVPKVLSLSTTQLACYILLLIL